MKVVYITPEEPFYLPTFFDTLFSRRRNDENNVVIVSPIYKNNTWFSQSKKVIDSFGMWTFFKEAFAYSWSKFLNMISKFNRLSRFYSVQRVAKYYSCTISETKNINDPEFIRALRTFAPDLIVSVSSPQIFKNALIDVPRLGCINLHGAILPRYRGILPSFWMLANNEKKAGVTVHFITKGIDDGEIIAQKEFDILPEDTLHTLVFRSKKQGAELLIKTLAEFEQGKVETTANPCKEGSYFSWPTRDAVKTFKQNGRRVR